MAIQNRRGSYTNFDPSKMVAGEFAVVQANDPNTSDGKAVYLALTSGVVMRLVFASEVSDLVDAAILENLDATLTETGKAADAGAVGTAITNAKATIDNNGIIHF